MKNIDEKRKIVLKEDLIKGFKEAGVREGQSIMVHTSLNSLGFVCGGAQRNNNDAYTKLEELRP